MGKECQKDINRLQEIWKKNLEGTKEAFEKGKAFIQRKSNSNETKTNEENNVSNTKENGNINEERRDIPNPRIQNSYNHNQCRCRNRSNRYNSKNYHKHYPPRQRQHLRFWISHLMIFETSGCLYYVIAQNLHGPGLEAYLVIKMALIILPKKFNWKRYIMILNMKMNRLYVINAQETLKQKVGNYY